MDRPILELRNICKYYGPMRSVDDISVNLAQGEFLSFLGPSGSGKTTTLNMIAGLAEPTSGDIFLQGRSIVSLPPYRRNIGVVFQNYALFPHMSVAANIAFPLEMRGGTKSEIRERVVRALDLVELSGFGDRLPSQLSGGQQQRVALARAMVYEPPLLLMDEPLGALDKQLREQMQIEIRHLHMRVGISVIYVTHDQDEALTMSDRIAVFNNGKIEQLGSPSDLYDWPSTLFVAGFVGHTNLLPGRVTNLSGETCQISSSGFDFRARRNDAVAPGQDVMVALRPERIHVAPAQAAPPADHNVVVGTVVETVYFGRFRRYVIGVGDLKISVSQQIESHAEPPLSLAESVLLHWRADNATVLTA